MKTKIITFAALVVATMVITAADSNWGPINSGSNGSESCFELKKEIKSAKQSVRTSKSLLKAHQGSHQACRNLGLSEFQCNIMGDGDYEEESLQEAKYSLEDAIDNYNMNGCTTSGNNQGPSKSGNNQGTSKSGNNQGTSKSDNNWGPFNGGSNAGPFNGYNNWLNDTDFGLIFDTKNTTDSNASGVADATAKGQADTFAKAQADAYAKGYKDAMAKCATSNVTQ